MDRKTIALTRQTFDDKVISLLFNMLSRLVLTFLPRSKRLLISWLQSSSAVILEPPQNKVSHCFHCFPIYLSWSDGTGWHDLSFLNVECLGSVLSHHNKNLKWWTSVSALGQTMWYLSDRLVFQLCVTAQLYLENKGKYILEAWWHADPKEERERVNMWERPLALWLLFLYVSFSSPGPTICELG